MGALAADQGPIGNIPAMGAPDTSFEAPEVDYGRMIAERERELGLAAELPAAVSGSAYYAPAEHYTPPSRHQDDPPYAPPSAPAAPVDLSGLPERFTLLVERKGDWWKITAPQSHIGLFVAHQDLFVALSDVPGSLAQILRLDGEVPAKATRKRK